VVLEFVADSMWVTDRCGEEGLSHSLLHMHLLLARWATSYMLFALWAEWAGVESCSVD
jgi:hypothetical protein